jgi:hypothetical protein
MLFQNSDTLADGWNRREIARGAPIQNPERLFTKLDDSIIEEENVRLASE